MFTALVELEFVDIASITGSSLSTRPRLLSYQSLCLFRRGGVELEIMFGDGAHVRNLVLCDCVDDHFGGIDDEAWVAIELCIDQPTRRLVTGDRRLDTELRAGPGTPAETSDTELAAFWQISPDVARKLQDGRVIHLPRPSVDDIRQCGRDDLQGGDEFTPDARETPVLVNLHQRLHLRHDRWVDPAVVHHVRNQYPGPRPARVLVRQDLVVDQFQ